MSSEIALRVSHVNKIFRNYSNPARRLTHALNYRANTVLARLGVPTLDTGGDDVQEYVALQDISFEVMRGHTTGIVGRNGAGKSTLLQIIAGTLTPTSGTVEVEGRVAALLELGSGFNPDFSGIENARLNATILGLSPAEIDKRMDSILAFADIGAFAHRPVKTYSSGMVVRLAFAVQAQVDPEILIVDEALAVGDAKFQSKCFARLETLKEAGTSILFVSHSTEQIVSHCDDAILIESGRLHQRGQPKDVAHTYLELLFGAAGNRSIVPATSPVALDIDTDRAVVDGETHPAAIGDGFALQPNYNPYEFRWGDGGACIADFRLLVGDKQAGASIEAGTALQLRLGISFTRNIRRPIFGFTIKSKDGVTVFGTNSEMTASVGDVPSAHAGSAIELTFDFDCNLGPGDYFISVGVASRDGDDVIPHDRRYDSIHMNVTDESCFGFNKLPLEMRIKELHT
jgi:lipopolysaccharide transport system ATP-binding protein